MHFSDISERADRKQNLKQTQFAFSTNSNEIVENVYGFDIIQLRTYVDVVGSFLRICFVLLCTISRWFLPEVVASASFLQA